ncbi:MAG: hypothetical protein FWF49_05085, partial [Oscillospiraceae bacterium]|nr:hypothetical protein [Oscillospiraceae bacterium]
MASIEKKTYWRRALVCLAGIPLLPEYLCPVLVFLAFGFAAADAARAGRRWRVGTVGWLILLYTAYLFLGAFFSAHILNSLL